MGKTHGMLQDTNTKMVQTVLLYSLHLKRREKKNYYKFGMGEAVPNQKSKGYVSSEKYPKDKNLQKYFKSEIFKSAGNSIRILKGAVEKRCQCMFGSLAASHT